MPIDLTPAEIEILLLALNDREGVLSTDWQRASDANSTAQMMALCDQLREVRNLADKLRA